MFKKIASMDDQIRLKKYELRAVLGGGCGTYCPTANGIGGFCCQGEKGYDAYVVIYDQD